VDNSTAPDAAAGKVSVKVVCVPSYEAVVISFHVPAFKVADGIMG
jgi:hypothetical protein